MKYCGDKLILRKNNNKNKQNNAKKSKKSKYVTIAHKLK